MSRWAGKVKKEVTVGAGGGSLHRRKSQRASGGQEENDNGYISRASLISKCFAPICCGSRIKRHVQCCATRTEVGFLPFGRCVTCVTQ